MTATAGSTLGGAVYDRGYRPYAGPMGGRGRARWALFRLTVRRALGLRRTWRQKVLPWSLLAIATIPAIVNVGIGYATRDTPASELDFEFITYHEYVGVSTMLLLFLAVSAPDAVGPDRRNRVLPLLFSRPLTGVDYVVAKVAALTALIFGFGVLPQVVLFVGQTMVHDDGAADYIGDNAEVMWQVPAAVAVLAVYFAVIGIALSSFSGRRVVGAVAILGVAMVSEVVAGILVAAGGWEGLSNQGSAGALFGVISIPLFLRDVIFFGEVESVSPLGGVEGGGMMALMVYVALIAIGLAVLLWRYREVKL